MLIPIRSIVLLLQTIQSWSATFCRPEGVDLHLSRCSKLRNGVKLGPPPAHWMMINLYTSTSGVKIWQPNCFYLEDLGSFSSILWMCCSPHDRNTTPSGRRYVWQQWKDHLAIECCGVWSTITETSCHDEDHIHRQLERSTCQSWVNSPSHADLPAKSLQTCRPKQALYFAQKTTPGISYLRPMVAMQPIISSLSLLGL